MLCIYCNQSIFGWNLYHPDCFNSEYAIKLRRYAFLTGYAAKNENEKKETTELKEYFVKLGKDPNWEDAQTEGLGDLDIFLQKKG